MEIDERTRMHLKEIFETIEKRKDTFGNAFVGVAFAKNEKSELRVFYGLVSFLRKGDAPIQKTTYDYGRFVLSKKSVEISDAVDLIHSIWEKQVLKFDDFPEVPLKASLGEIHFVQSRGRHGPISSEWPILYADCRIDNATRGKIPHDPLAKLGLPLFPRGLEAINTFLELHLPRDYYHLESSIHLRIPDYRARIGSLRVAGDRVSIDVQTGEAPQKDLVAKFYCKSENRSYTSKDLPLEEGHVSYSMDDEPLLVEAHLLSAVDGESIDRRKFDYRYPSREEGIVIEEIEAQLLDIIDKGENINVEFKRELDKDRSRFLETVVAFANTSGGTIFLGVDNNCRIKGFKENISAKIVDLVADHCDPPIEIRTDSDVLVQGVPITLVRVPEGTNKPYTLENKGIFVRRGSSNRQIKRTELDDIYQAKTQSISTY